MSSFICFRKKKKKKILTCCGTEVSINIGFLATYSIVQDSSLFLLFLDFSSTVCNHSGVWRLFVYCPIKTFFQVLSFKVILLKILNSRPVKPGKTFKTLCKLSMNNLSDLNWTWFVSHWDVAEIFKMFWGRASRLSQMSLKVRTRHTNVLV